MIDTRLAFSEAAAGFVDAVLSVPDDAWSSPGLGVWTVRDLVGHTSRALTTIETYLDAADVDGMIPSPIEYFRRALGGVSPAAHEAIAERGRQAGIDLGGDPVGAIRVLADRVLARVASEPDHARCNTFAGAMRLIDYLPTRVVELTVHSLDLTDAIGGPPTVRSTPVQLTMGIVLEHVDPLVLLRALGGRRALPAGFSVFG
jgi:hypothetical protein